MKASEIKKGGHYIAKVSGNLVTVRVDEIREMTAHRMNHFSGRLERSSQTVYNVTNLDTGRYATFKSAAKFRRPSEVRVHRQGREMERQLYPDPAKHGSEDDMICCTPVGPTSVAKINAQQGREMEEALGPIESKSNPIPSRKCEAEDYIRLAEKLMEQQTLTVQNLKRYAADAPADPGPIADGLRGWEAFGLFVCSRCAGRIMARGCRLPDGFSPVWEDPDGSYLRQDNCCVCDADFVAKAQR